MIIDMVNKKDISSEEKKKYVNLLTQAALEIAK